MANISSPFLNILPPELRQQIYTHLLVSPTPIKGLIARQSTKYYIHTSILRTCKAIHTEARPIFFGRNTFSITSIPPSTSTEDDDGSGAFEPPLQLKDLPLVRHLEVDLLFYPKVLKMLEGRRYGGWAPVCPAAERYVGSLVALVGAVERGLVSLMLCADTRRYAQLTGQKDSVVTSSVGWDAGDEVLDLKKVLTGFHMADRNPRFTDALSKLRVEKIDLHFDFLESYFDFSVDREVLCVQKFVEFAGQVLIKRNDLQRDAAMMELDEDDKRSSCEESCCGIDSLERQ